MRQVCWEVLRLQSWGWGGREQRKDLERRERRLQIGLRSFNLPLLPHLDKNYYHSQSFFKHIKNPSSSQGLRTEPNLFPGGPQYTLPSLMIVFTSIPPHSSSFTRLTPLFTPGGHK